MLRAIPPTAARRFGTPAALAFLTFLAACGPTGPVASTPPPPKVQAPLLVVPPRPPERMEQRSAVMHMQPGLEGVIGATSAALTRLFGPARLDVIEGDARKLQFTSEVCVLDVYLYPRTRGGEPEATYTEARRASDGASMDSVTCVTALRPPAPVVPAAPLVPTPRKIPARR
jgi:predicted small lipoprotein YifL